MAEKETLEHRIERVGGSHQYPVHLWVIVVLGLLLFGLLMYGAPTANQAWGYGVNLFTSLISTAATVLILDQLAERRADRKAEEVLKRQLVTDTASLSHEIALNAVHQIRRKGWLVGESGLLRDQNLQWAKLQGVDLVNANLRSTKFAKAELQEAVLRLAELEGADLRSAILQRTDLSEAKLQGADLRSAELEGANLGRARLQGADLRWARLQGANLSFADLREANLTGANLEKANLWEANLQGAIISSTKFDKATFDKATLPDRSGGVLRVTPQTDIRRFIDSEHDSFWRSDDPKSPAYGGDGK